MFAKESKSRWKTNSQQADWMRKKKESLTSLPFARQSFSSSTYFHRTVLASRVFEPSERGGKTREREARAMNVNVKAEGREEGEETNRTS